MKKLMIGLLTAVTIMGMSVSAFAADLEAQKSKSEVIEDAFLISAPKDVDINLKGDDNLVKVAVWSANNMSYSISVNSGMAQDDIIKIIKSTF